jgi:hypothetical protein
MVEGMVWNKTKRIAFIVNIQIDTNNGQNNGQQSPNEEGLEKASL